MYYNINKRVVLEGKTIGYTVSGRGPDGMYDNTYIELRWFIPMVQKGIVKNVYFDGTKCIGVDGFKMSELPKLEGSVYNSCRERLKKILEEIVFKYHESPYGLEKNLSESLMKLSFHWYGREDVYWFEFDIKPDSFIFTTGEGYHSYPLAKKEISFKLSDKEILFELLDIIYRKHRFTFPLDFRKLQKLQASM